MQASSFVVASAVTTGVVASLWWPLESCQVCGSCWSRSKFVVADRSRATVQEGKEGGSRVSLAPATQTNEFCAGCSILLDQLMHAIIGFEQMGRSFYP